MQIEEIVIKAKTSERYRAEVLKKYTNLIYFLINKHQYHVFTMSQEDLYAELAISLMRAIDDYDETKSIKFITFLYVCLERKIYKIKRYQKVNKRKHYVVGIYENQISTDSFTYADVLADKTDVEYLNETKIKVDALESYANDVLKEDEQKLFDYYKKGYSRTKISEFMGWDKKKVSNKMYQIKKKLRRFDEK